MTKLLLLPLLLLSASCTFHAVNNIDSLRENAVNSYHRQIVDNLVRASNGMPILHVDYTTLSAVVAGKGTGAFDGGASESRTPLLRTITRPFTFKLTGEYSDTITANATPYIKDGVKYEPYLKYLNLTGPTQRLQTITDFDLRLDEPMPAIGKCADKTRPAKELYVPGTLRHVGDDYYYIPREYAQAYFDLCLDLISSVKAGKIELTSKPPGKKRVYRGGSGAKAEIRSFFNNNLDMLEQLDQKIEVLKSQTLPR